MADDEELRREYEQIRRRLRAGRVIAGVTVEELAARLGPGLQAGTLGKIERGERVARAMELREIAVALDLPYAFFTMDFHEAARALETQDSHPLGELPGAVAVEANVASLQERLQELGAQVIDDNQRFGELQAQVAELGQLVTRLGELVLQEPPSSSGPTARSLPPTSQSSEHESNREAGDGRRGTGGA